MLFLDRKLNETIQIGDDITVMVVAIDAVTKQVRLGTKAPPSVQIDRQEVHDRKKADRAVKAYLAARKGAQS